MTVLDEQKRLRENFAKAVQAMKNGASGTSPTGQGITALNRPQHEGYDATEKESPFFNGVGGDSSSDKTLATRPDMENQELFPEGLIRDFVLASTRDSEATPAGAAMGLLMLIMANAGRSLYFSHGNIPQYPILFALHVARSGKGKGVSLGSVKAVEREIRAKNHGLLGQTHSGGLSTREGVASAISDPLMDEEGNQVGGTEDKRLWVIESEFSNVLQQSKRDGNTLSACIRDLFDGMEIAPLTKTSKVVASDPCVSILGQITPAELVKLLDDTSVRNGFINRFLIFYSESTKTVALPEPWHDEELKSFAHRVATVIAWSKGQYPQKEACKSRRMQFSSDAKALYEKVYPRLKNPCLDDFLLSVLSRAPAHAVRLSMAFAICDMSEVIEVKHLRAALHWVKAFCDSANFIFQGKADEEKAEITNAQADKILAFLREHGEATRTDIYSRCFKRHYASSKITEALTFLLDQTPPRIKIREEKPQGQVRKTQYFSINEEVRNG